MKMVIITASLLLATAFTAFGSYGCCGNGRVKL